MKYDLHLGTLWIREVNMILLWILKGRVLEKHFLKSRKNQFLDKSFVSYQEVERESFLKHSVILTHANKNNFFFPILKTHLLKTFLHSFSKLT